MGREHRVSDGEGGLVGSAPAVKFSTARDPPENAVRNRSLASRLPQHIVAHSGRYV
jgi:hypothetical protein